MADEFYLDPVGLAQATSRLRASGDRLNSAFSKLTETLDQHDGCWGTDDIGKGFANKYVKPAADSTSGSREVIDSIGQLTGDLDKSSAEFQSVDHDSAVEMDKSTGSG